MLRHKGFGFQGFRYGRDLEPRDGVGFRGYGVLSLVLVLF